MNKEVVEPNWKMLEAMTMCSDNSFEGWIKAKLKTLIAMNEEGKHKDLETVKWGLLEVIDHCIHGSLCTSLILYGMQVEYKRLGGEEHPDISKTPWRKILN